MLQHYFEKGAVEDMNFERARQIMISDETIEVLYEGSPVWIESLNPENNTARVRPLDGLGSAREVPVTKLVEG